jgi:anti-sigma B factor antagonist
MQLVSEDRDGLRVITVADPRIDAVVAIQFKDLMRGLTESGPRRIVLDLAEVEFLDSSGLGALVAAMKQAGKDRRLELAGLSPMVEKVFRLTRMDSVFTIHADIGAATAGSVDAG